MAPQCTYPGGKFIDGLAMGYAHERKATKEKRTCKENVVCITGMTDV